MTVMMSDDRTTYLSSGHTKEEDQTSDTNLGQGSNIGPFLYQGKEWL